jgi:hypothetical protein
LALIAAIVVSGIVGILRPAAQSGALCQVTGGPAAQLNDASIDAGVSLSDSELSYPSGAAPAFARLPQDFGVNQITVDAADNVGLVGLVVAGFPSANAPYVVARATPSFGAISLVRVSGAEAKVLGSLVEGTPARGAIFGVRRTDTGIEVYRDCHFAGEFPLTLDELLSGQPRFAIELMPRARVSRIEFS